MPVCDVVLLGLIPWARHGASFIVNGSSGSVQFYDALHDIVLMELAVVPRPRESARFRGKSRDPSEGSRPVVLQVACSSDAQWLVCVVQQRRGPVQMPTYTLTFWQWNDTTVPLLILISPTKVSDNDCRLSFV